jgi:ferredoxin
VKVVIDAAVCTGHGRCYLLVPELFEDDEFGHGTVRGDGTFTETQRPSVQRAITACPEQAISVE